MMTPLETLLAAQRWCWTGKAFTTIVNGYGFVIYRMGYKMWLAGLSKEVTTDQLKTHNTQPPHLVVCLEPTNVAQPTPRLFDIPASPELISAVVMSTYPELTNDLRRSVPSVRNPSKVLGWNASVRPSRRPARR